MFSAGELLLLLFVADCLLSSGAVYHVIFFCVCVVCVCGCVCLCVCVLFFIQVLQWAYSFIFGLYTTMRFSLLFAYLCIRTGYGVFKLSS